jgi:hypothetical protein
MTLSGAHSRGEVAACGPKSARTPAEAIVVLLQFAVENHRSLRDEQTLTLTAASLRDRSEATLHTVPGLEDPVLPAAALYGANASGKTNVLHALAFMRSAVLSSHRLWEPESGTPQQAFALDERANEPSTFEVDVWVDARYRYGFVLSAARVEEEWLYSWPQGRKQTWFERAGDELEFGRNFHGENETIRGLTRQNSLFLSAAAQNNHAAILPVFSWFRRLATVMRTGRDGAAGGLAAEGGPWVSELFGRQMSLLQEDNDARVALVRLLHAADTGIVDIKIDEREGPAQRGGAGLYRRRPALLFKHRSASGRDAWLPLEAQSAGTITLLEIGLSLIKCLQRGGVLCVDELEASLHPILALELLRLFHDRAENPARAQLLFTTHDTNLLGNILGASPLRRDQIWFTEKDRDGATHLYPLTDFHPRKEENVERGYLQGRYGAVPLLGKLVGEGEGR